MEIKFLKMGKRYVMLEGRNEGKEKTYKVMHYRGITKDYVVLATFYWKEVADTYFDACEKYGHMNLRLEV